MYTTSWNRMMANATALFGVYAGGKSKRRGGTISLRSVHLVNDHNTRVKYWKKKIQL